MFRFTCFGHENITGTHKTTFEFTRHTHLTTEGHCILGVNADYDATELKDFVEEKIAKGSAALLITVKVNDMTETIKATLNSAFNDQEEIVVRKSNFVSNRTLGLYADKACKDFKRRMIKAMQNSSQKIIVTLR